MNTGLRKSARRGAGDFLGKGVPAVILYECGEPVDVYPRRVGDEYETIRRYLEGT